MSFPEDMVSKAIVCTYSVSDEETRLPDTTVPNEQHLEEVVTIKQRLVTNLQQQSQSTGDTYCYSASLFCIIFESN